MDTRVFLEGINQKSGKAWKELYRYYYAPLCSYAERILGDAGAAEDCVQECMIGMWHKKEVTFEDMKSLTAWLYRSVYHRTISILREWKVRDHYRQTQEIASEDEPVGITMALREEIISQFYEVLHRLPMQQHNILKYSLKGLTVQEIALQLCISENSVKTQKKRAYQFIREQFDESLLQLLLLMAFPEKQITSDIL